MPNTLRVWSIILTSNQTWPSIDGSLVFFYSTSSSAMFWQRSMQDQMVYLGVPTLHSILPRLTTSRVGWMIHIHFASPCWMTEQYHLTRQSISRQTTSLYTTLLLFPLRTARFFYWALPPIFPIPMRRSSLHLTPSWSLPWTPLLLLGLPKRWLMLCLTRVEANIDSKILKEQGILEGLLQGTLMLGASTATLSNNWLR